MTGSKVKKISEIRADECVHYGLLKGKKQADVSSLVDYLVSKDYLQLVGDRYPLVHVTNRGWDVLDGKARVKRRQEVKSEQLAETGGDQVLFEELRKARRILAQKRGVPPFVIFSDLSLRDMQPGSRKRRKSCSSVAGSGMPNWPTMERPCWP